jgi:8-oxo-dGTP pyrophosphatase MutT (NUDIX family)
MGNQFYTGAGVLPYTIYNGTTLLLFQQTFEGKKVGTLIDFGGARAPSDASALETAAREFVEEGGLLLLNALGVKSSPAEIKELSEVALQENSMTIAASLALLADMKTPKKPLFEGTRFL